MNYVLDLENDDFDFITDFLKNYKDGKDSRAYHIFCKFLYAKPIHTNHNIQFLRDNLANAQKEANKVLKQIMEEKAKSWSSSVG